jgi:hypothetical protein
MLIDEYGDPCSLACAINLSASTEPLFRRHETQTTKFQPNNLKPFDPALGEAFPAN